MAYPTDLDSFSDVVDNTTDATAANHNAIQDAIEALEAKVGADSSAVTTSHDYMLNDSDSPVVTKTGTQTLTNKTLTSPVLTTPSINGATPDEDAKAAFVGEQHSLTVTGTNWTTGRAKALFSKTSDDVWYMDFQITGVTSPTTDSIDLTIAGVGFYLNTRQAIAVQGTSGVANGYAFSTGGVIYLDSTLACYTWAASGKVELSEKPTGFGL